MADFDQVCPPTPSQDALDLDALKAISSGGLTPQETALVRTPWPCLLQWDPLSVAAEDRPRGIVVPDDIVPPAPGRWLFYGVLGPALYTTLLAPLVVADTASVAVTATATVDFSASPRHVLTLGGNTALTFIAPPGSCSLLLTLIQDGTGSRLPTFPASVRGTVANTVPIQGAAGSVTLLALSFDVNTGLYTINTFAAGNGPVTGVLV